MARGGFSTANYLYNNSLQVSSGIFSVCAWVYPTAEATVRNIWGLFDDAADTSYLRLIIDATDHVAIEVRAGAGTTDAVTTGTVTEGAWNLIGMSYAPLLRLRVWVANEIVSNVTSIPDWPAGLDRTAVGMRHTSTAAEAFGGYASELAVWKGSAITPAMIAFFQGRRRFSDYGTSQPDHYYRPGGITSVVDRIGSFDLTEAGVVADVSPDPILQAIAARVTNHDTFVGGETPSRRRAVFVEP